jgi:hypothetical protein
MRRLNRGRILAALMGAAAMAAMTAGCSSGGTASGTEAPPHGTVQSAGYKDGQVMKKCLHSYGLSRSGLRQTFRGTGTGSAAVSQATLKKAGEQCWKPAETGLAASAIRRLDSCLGLEHVPVAHTRSPLADVLLAFDTHSPKMRNALKFCLRS